jgi:hypothetical protein
MGGMSLRVALACANTELSFATSHRVCDVLQYIG